MPRNMACLSPYTSAPQKSLFALLPPLVAMPALLPPSTRCAAMIANIAPTASAKAETTNTLKFAARAKQIKNTARINEDVSMSAVEMSAEIARLRAEVAVLRGAQAAGGGPANTSDGGGNLAAALALNEELEARMRQQQEQLGRLRQ